MINPAGEAQEVLGKCSAIDYLVLSIAEGDVHRQEFRTPERFSALSNNPFSTITIRTI